MKLTGVESTKVLSLVGDIPVRVWNGRTEAGVPVELLVCAVKVRSEHDQAELMYDLLQIERQGNRFVRLRDLAPEAKS